MVDNALGDFFLLGDYNVSIDLRMCVDVMFARCAMQCASFVFQIEDKCFVFHCNSGKTHTREERNWCAVVVNKPLKVLGKHFLTIHSEGRKNSIEARFGGFGLITTIEQFDPGFTNPSNQIAMQIHIRNMGARDNLSVCNFQILAIFNSSDHLEFDLTHWVGSLCLYEYTIARVLGVRGVWWTVPRLSHPIRFLYTFQ